MKSHVRSHRRGFAMILVTAEVTMLSVAWGIAHRQTTSLLRQETVLVERARRDEGSFAAVAKGLGLLETGLPPGSPFFGSVTLATGTGDVGYVVTFTDIGEGRWKVEAARVTPHDLVDPLPATFAPAPDPPEKESETP